jgi:adenine-specific DNA-methyltransferase
MGKLLGQRTSSLSGLHAHFFLATALLARERDIGCFVTSSEWLDVNYGSVIRTLLAGRLGARSLHVIEPRTTPFADAMTTAVISCFEVGANDGPIQFRLVGSVADLASLDAGYEILREVASASQRWSPYLGARPAEQPDGVLPLREIAEVHRGLVTGANDFFVLSRERARYFGIEQWCRPAITSAQEILQAEGIVRDTPACRLLLDIPRAVRRDAHPQLDAYLRLGEGTNGTTPPICERYIPSHRRPRWYLGHQAPPPIVATYMARQAPMFALNPDGLALLNIGHGIYPRAPLAEPALVGLADSLNGSRERFRGRGRTYHGGLEKFEPREMESLLVHPPGRPKP